MNIVLTAPMREKLPKAFGNGIMIIMNKFIALNAINSLWIDSKFFLDVRRLNKMKIELAISGQI